MRNVEAKLPCDAAVLAAVRERALLAGAHPVAVMRQVDTYFNVPRGRLKLREISRADQPPEAMLIGYARSDTAGARTSAYEIVVVPDPGALLAVLTPALGMRLRVVKRRELLWLRHTRLHLDDVERLGRFIEFETLVGARDERRGEESGLATVADAERELAEIASVLGLALSHGLPGSYADLLAAAEEGR